MIKVRKNKKNIIFLLLLIISIVFILRYLKYKEPNASINLIIENRQNIIIDNLALVIETTKNDVRTKYDIFEVSDTNKNLNKSIKIKNYNDCQLLVRFKLDNIIREEIIQYLPSNYGNYNIKIIIYKDDNNISAKVICYDLTGKSKENIYLLD